MELGVQTNHSDTESYVKWKLVQTSDNMTQQAEHKVKKGESLWSIAKKYLGKQKATNGEICDYMYKIAKFNNKETLEEFNKLDVNDTLYIPDADQGPVPVFNLNGLYEHPKLESLPKQTTATKPKVSNAERLKNSAKNLNELTAPEGKSLSYSIERMTRQRKALALPDEPLREHGQAGFNNWVDDIKSGKNIVVQRSYTSDPLKPSGLVIMKKKPYSMTSEALMYVLFKPDGTIREISYDSPGFNIKDISLDYTVNSDNKNLQVVTGSVSKRKNIGKISTEEFNSLQNVLTPLYNEYIKSKK